MNRFIVFIAALIAAPAYGMSRLLLPPKSMQATSLFTSEAKSKKMAYQKRFCTLKKTEDEIEDLRKLIVLKDCYEKRITKN